jgi:hypothetical protein
VNCRTEWFSNVDILFALHSNQTFSMQINQKGSEKPLELAFDKMVTSLGNSMIK